MGLYEGKEALTEAGYELLMKLFLNLDYVTKEQMDWAPLAASLCRNTLMRITFAGKTAYAICEWRNDHFIITYSRDKCDQTGERTIPRSLYSNPENPL